MRTRLALLAALLIVALPTAAQLPTPQETDRYYFTDTGIDSVTSPEVPGAVNSEASAVGSVYDAVNTSGAYWRPSFGSGNKVVLAKTASGEANYVHDVSDSQGTGWPDEDIVGKAVTYSGGLPSGSQPTVWYGYTDLFPKKRPVSGYNWGSFRACGACFFTGVSAHVRAVGWASNSEAGDRVPIWCGHGDLNSRVLLPPTGSTWGGDFKSAEAMDVNQDGVIVGYIVEKINDAYYTLPCRWVPDPDDGNYLSSHCQVLPQWPSDPDNGLVEGVARAIAERTSSTIGDEYIEGTTVSSPKAFTYKYTAHTSTHILEYHDYTDQGWKVNGYAQAVATLASPPIGYFIFSSGDSPRPGGNKVYNDIDGWKGHNQVLAQQMYDSTKESDAAMPWDAVLTTTGNSSRLYVGRSKKYRQVSIKDEDNAGTLGYDPYKVWTGTALNAHRPISPFDDWVDELVGGFDNSPAFQVGRGPSPVFGGPNVVVDFVGDASTLKNGAFTFQFSGRVSANADIRVGLQVYNFATSSFEPATVSYVPIRTAWKSYTLSVPDDTFSNYFSGTLMKGRVNVKFFGVIEPAAWYAEFDQILFIWNKP